MSSQEERNKSIAEFQAKLGERSTEIRPEREVSNYESSQQAVIDEMAARKKEAIEAGETDPAVLKRFELPEGRQTVEENIKAADEVSWPKAYKDQKLDAGDNLLNDEPSPAVSIDLQSAIRKTIENNLDLRVARLNPQISALQIEQAEAVFDSVIFADFNFAELDTPQPPGAIPGLSGDQQSETRALSTGIRKDLTTGGRITAQADVNRSQQAPSFFGVNRFYSSDLLVQLEQPLLRGFGSDVARANIDLAGIANKADEAALRQTMIERVNAVEQTYWQLVAARSSLLIQQRLFERSVTLGERYRKRFGFDVLQSDLDRVNARIDARKGDVLRAQLNLRALSDELKRLINDPDLPVTDETLLEPSDAPAEDAIVFDLVDQFTTALQQRPEIETALLAIDDADVRRVVADNAQLPILNLVASATANGLDVNDGGDALGNALDFDYIDYALGIQFERPWGNRAAESLFNQRTLERQRALENYKNQAQIVTVEVKNALRSVNTNYRLIDIARSQRRAAASTLATEEFQLEEGGNNNESFTTRLLRVLDTQEQLAQGELSEVQAQSDYMIAVSELRRATGTSLKQAGVEVDSGEK